MKVARLYGALYYCGGRRDTGRESKTTGLSSGVWMSTQLRVHEKEWSKHRGGRIIIGNQQTKRFPYVMECWDGLCDSHLKWKDNVWMGSPVRSSKEHPLNRGATSSGHACAQCGSKHPKIALMSKNSPLGLTLVRKQNKIQHLIMWSHNFQPPMWNYQVFWGWE